MISNAESALSQACLQTNATVCEFTVAPIFLNKLEKGGHEWLVEFRKEPTSLYDFSKYLDQHLQLVNHDYAAKRYKNLVLQLPTVTAVPKGSFHRWMKSKGKLGGQHKVPRLSSTRNLIEEIMRYVFESNVYV